MDHYHIIAETISDAIYTRDEAGTILSVNSAAERMFGYSAAEMIGQPIIRMLAKPHLPIDEMRRGARAEATGLHKTGRHIPISISFGEFRRGSQRVLTGVVRDETESYRAKTMLAASEGKYRSLVNSVKEVIFQTDARGCWTFLNPIWAEITGFRVEDALGRTFLDFIHSEDRPSAAESFASLISEKNDYYRDELRYLTKDGGIRWIESSVRVVLDADGRVLGASGSLNDVTGRKRVEEDLRVAKAAAESANRTKDEFLSRVSHELRTPMHAILGFTQLLDLDELTVEQKSNVGRILKAGRHLQDLLKDILDISRIESGRLAIELERVDPIEVLRAAVDLAQPLLAERHIELIQSVEGPRVEVLADRHRLMQVYLNLLSNAVKYNRENGQVVLNYDCVNGHVRVKVTDTGDGIPKESLPKLFQPFERLGAERSKIAGTGLGLALSKRMVELMQGRIGVSSIPGTGSSFWIEFPRLELLPTTMTTESGLVPSHVPCPTVLYIEDTPTSILLVQSVFERSLKVRFITAMLGSLGLEMARLHTPSLILLDLHLPDMAGTEVLRQLRAHPRTASIPVVVLTADALPSTEHQMLEAGAVAFMRKPINVKALMATVRPILEKDPITI